MQGKQTVSNLERKGPHKSMHCKFCKVPGVVTPETTTRAHLETKTKIHLAHEAADLRLCNTHDESNYDFGRNVASILSDQRAFDEVYGWKNERKLMMQPGFPTIESEACMCVLEGENPCPKCVPDKNKKPAKKKTCRCPKGAKPHPNMLVEKVARKKKQETEDDEFWWEKYSREHDAVARETWAAYMAQRRKDKMFAKFQRQREAKLVKKSDKGSPVWYQKLSCQQMIFLEFLSTAIRLDSDENITDRTLYVLGGVGLYPRPRRKIIKKCLRYCHYNSIQFLDQLRLLTQRDDPFFERNMASPADAFTWNDRLIMNSICYLEFPMLLREMMDRLPPFPREKILPQIPYPVFPTTPPKKYDNPYEEPIWHDHLNWIEKMKIDRLNRSRAHMDTKRVKIPPLALVRRPSLIDARPPFLSQIEANEQASRRLVKEKGKKVGRKHPISIFNSEVDVTAIAGIEASEISTTDKADTDEICVFLQEPFKDQELTEDEEEEKVGEEEEEEEEDEEISPGKGIRFFESETTEVNRSKSFSDFEEYDGEEVKFPFKTPPKTESGHTIIQPCAPPEASPGPPALHYDVGKRELDAINEELCGFQPFVSSSAQIMKAVREDRDEVTEQLTSAAEKLKQFVDEKFDAKDKERIQKKKFSKKQNKCKKRKKKRENPTKKVINKKVSSSKTNSYFQNVTESELQENNLEEEEDDEIIDIDLILEKKIERKEIKLTKKESIISDPDPESEDEWFRREPCSRKSTLIDEIEEKGSRNRKVKKNKLKRKNKGKRSKHRGGKRGKYLPEENQKYSKNKNDKGKEKLVTSHPEVGKTDKETMTEYHSGQGSRVESEPNKPVDKKGKSAEQGEEEAAGEEKERTFTGEVTLLLINILKDLADEGYLSAAYYNIHIHPDINQLVQYLKGEIITKQTRERLHLITKNKWTKMKGLRKFDIPDLGLSSKRMLKATWNDKRWVSQRAKAKKDEFYFKVAKNRADFGREMYSTLYQNYFGTARYLKIYYAYMTSKYEDAILRGIV